MTHNCIKCKNEYSDDDIDAYYCPVCLEEKKKIAKEVDSKISNLPKKHTKTFLQQYDEARGKAPFPSIKSLGITL